MRRSMILPTMPPELSTANLPRMAVMADPQATADYIGDISLEMQRMAESANLDMLAYLLGMVRAEAELIRKRAEEAERRRPPAEGEDA